MDMRCENIWRSPTDNCNVVSLTIIGINNKTVDFRKALYDSNNKKMKKSRFGQNTNNDLCFGVDVLFKPDIEIHPYISDESGNYMWKCNPGKLSPSERQAILFYAMKLENEYEMKKENMEVLISI